MHSTQCQKYHFLPILCYVLGFSTVFLHITVVTMNKFKIHQNHRWKHLIWTYHLIKCVLRNLTISTKTNLSIWTRSVNLLEATNLISMAEWAGGPWRSLRWKVYHWVGADQDGVLHRQGGHKFSLLDSSKQVNSSLKIQIFVFMGMEHLYQPWAQSLQK